MSSCHTISTIVRNNKEILVGDPLEISLFQFTNSKFIEN
jgi:hypothetical protein